MLTSLPGKIESLLKLCNDIAEIAKQILDLLKNKQIAEPIEKEPSYLTICEAADFCRVSRKTFERWNKANLVTATYVGRSPFFNKATLAHEIKANKLDTARKACKC